VWLLTSVIPATQEAEIERILIRASPGKKLVRPHLNKTSWAWWCVPVIPTTQEDLGGSKSKAGPGTKSKTLTGKQPKAKSAGDVAQVLESLLSKYKALSSNPEQNKKRV
jgi:hypothetical protein